MSSRRDMLKKLLGGAAAAGVAGTGLAKAIPEERPETDAKDQADRDEVLQVVMDLADAVSEQNDYLYQEIVKLRQERDCERIVICKDHILERELPADEDEVAERMIDGTLPFWFAPAGTTEEAACGLRAQKGGTSFYVVDYGCHSIEWEAVKVGDRIHVFDSEETGTIKVGGLPALCRDKQAYFGFFEIVRLDGPTVLGRRLEEPAAHRIHRQAWANAPKIPDIDLTSWPYTQKKPFVDPDPYWVSPQPFGPPIWYGGTDSTAYPGMQPVTKCSGTVSTIGTAATCDFGSVQMWENSSGPGDIGVLHGDDHSLAYHIQGAQHLSKTNT